MKILLVSPFLPYAQAKSGAPRAIFDRLQLLSLRHEISLATFVDPDEAARRTELAQLGVRVYNVVRQENGASGRGFGLWRKRALLVAGLLTDKRPMLVQEFGSQLFCRLLRRLVREQKFDVVMLEHILMAQYMRCLQRSNLPVMLTEHDVRAAFPGNLNRRGRRSSLVEMPLAAIDRAKWAAYARTAYREAMCVLVPTNEDALLLEKSVPGIHARIVPFGLPSSISPADDYGHSPRPAPAREAESLLFVGNFDHPPNRDAVLWLCSEIMPLVWRERPQTELWVVGRNPTPDIEALGSSRVRIWGEAPSVREYLHRCTLFVAPLRQGGGMRIKLLEALAAATPTVTTMLGAQGLSAENGKHLLVADGAESFAQCVLSALGDPALRDRLSAEGAELVSSRERKSKRAQMLESVLAEARVQSSKFQVQGGDQATLNLEPGTLNMEEGQFTGANSGPTGVEL